MLSHYKTIRDVADRLSNAAVGTCDSLVKKRVEQEHHFTDRMLGAMEYSVNDFKKNGIQWNAKTLTDRGINAQESTYGADFLGVLDIDIEGFKVAKGFLAQAKLLREGRSIDMTELREQCNKLLIFSPDSFVFLYKEDGIDVYPAISVVSSDKTLTSHYSRSIKSFFELHLECFIGDRKINTASAEQLKRLLEVYNSRSGLLLQARDG